MANKWRDDDYNRWSEEDVRRSRGARYDQARQFSQDYSGARQYESSYGSEYRPDYSPNRDWERAQRERLRRSAPDMYPQDREPQQESFAPGTFYYGGEPQRRFGAGPTVPGFDSDTAPAYGSRFTPMPASYGSNYGYVSEADRDDAFRQVAAFERDFMTDETPDRFHPEKHTSKENYRRWYGHRGKGPKGYTRSDERIREDISDRLTHDHYVDASNIEIQVTSAECTLNGTVATRDEKRRAEDIAEHVMGVKHVQNNLRVAPAYATPLSSQDRTGTMSTAIGSTPTLSASRNSSSNG
jgi:hypothetical protein